MALISHGGGNCELATGKTVFDYADELAVQVPTSCGRMGHCHECVVEVKRGMEALCPRTEPESFLRGDYRLACQAVIRNADCDVEFALLRRRPQILTSTPEKPLELDGFLQIEGPNTGNHFPLRQLAMHTADQLAEDSLGCFGS